MTNPFDTLNDLEAKAKAATIDYICGADTSLTRKYIHACHPETVLALITALREAGRVISVFGELGNRNAKDWLAKYAKGEE